MNSTQQNDTNGCTPLAEPTGSQKVVIVVGIETIIRLLQGDDVETSFGTLIPSSDLHIAARRRANTKGQTRGGSRVV